LEVVHRARRAAAETSGAISGAKVAAYLRGGEQKPAGDKILERLAAPQPPRPAPTPIPEAVPTVNEKKLDALTHAQPTQEPKPAPESEKAADLEKADEKLSSLLGKPK